MRSSSHYRDALQTLEPFRISDTIHTYRVPYIEALPDQCLGHLFGGPHSKGEVIGIGNDFISASVTRCTRFPVAHATNICQVEMLILACSFLADEQQHGAALDGEQVKSIMVYAGLMKAQPCLMERLPRCTCIG